LIVATNEAKEKISQFLNRAEYTVFEKVLKASKLGALLNEKDIPSARAIKLPKAR